MEVCKLLGVTKPYIWGGNKLREYGKNSEDEIIAESWELSCHKDGISIIDSGKNKGKKLNDVITKEDLGTNCEKFPFFPVLIKLIDAKDNLSIQVHPSDEYALKNENSFGKTEMWYVLDADKDAMLHIGLNKNCSKEEFKNKILDNTLTDVLNHIKVKAGDCYFIPSGTIHAIGKGCLILEIQENSNLTYRVYDYGRKDKFGNQRELHIEKAMKVANLNKSNPINIDSKILANCEYFQVIKETNIKELSADKTSFICCTFISGNGFINDIPFSKGDTFFIPSNQRAIIKGDSSLIYTKIN